MITAGQVADCAQAIVLLGECKAEAVIADKGYDTDAIVEHIEAMGSQSAISPRYNRKVQREYDENLYRKRNRIERCFSKLKQFRRFAACYEKSKTCFQAMVAIACSWIILQLYVDTASSKLPSLQTQIVGLILALPRKMHLLSRSPMQQGLGL